MSELRCIHRHTPEEHPGCFKKGKIKREDWWRDMRIGYLDIETSNLDADWGIILSWCIKPQGVDKVLYDVISKEELFNGKLDKRVVNSLLNAMKEFDILVTYYGTGFDLPFIRTRSGLSDEFPAYGSIYHWDLYYKVRNKMKLSRNSLGNATKYLGIPGKTPMDGEMIMKARYGDKKALAELLVHNIGDVYITEKLHNKLKRFSKWIRTSI
jgi:uncharacterized protein YprB with RNaseH-like and TPR domain